MNPKSLFESLSASYGGEVQKGDDNYGIYQKLVIFGECNFKRTKVEICYRPEHRPDYGIRRSESLCVYVAGRFNSSLSIERGKMYLNCEEIDHNKATEICAKLGIWLQDGKTMDQIPLVFDCELRNRLVIEDMVIPSADALRIEIYRNFVKSFLNKLKNPDAKPPGNVHQNIPEVIADLVKAFAQLLRELGYVVSISGDTLSTSLPTKLSS